MAGISSLLSISLLFDFGSDSICNEFFSPKISTESESLSALQLLTETEALASFIDKQKLNFTERVQRFLGCLALGQGTLTTSSADPPEIHIGPP